MPTVDSSQDCERTLIHRALTVRMGKDEEEWEQERASEVAYGEFLRGL